MIGDMQLHMVMPKAYDISQIMMATENSNGVLDSENMRVMMRFAGRLINYIVEEPRTASGDYRGREWVAYRLQDPDDKFDLVNLVPILTDLMRSFLARPTGSPPASSAPRRPASPARASAARTRSTRAKT